MVEIRRATQLGLAGIMQLPGMMLQTRQANDVSDI
jgi:hypothetical protein